MFGEKGGIGKLEPLGTKKIGDKGGRGEQGRHWKARGAFGDKEVRGQRRSGTEKFGDKDVQGQRRQRRAGEPLGTKKFGDKGGKGEL